MDVEVVVDGAAVVDQIVVENTGGAVDVEVVVVVAVVVEVVTVVVVVEAVVDGAAVVDQIVVENTEGAVDGIGTMFSSSETVVGQKDLAQIHHEL